MCAESPDSHETGSQEIAVEESRNICIGISPIFEDRFDALEIGDGVEISWALLPPEPAIEIAADSDMVCISRQLTDVINVISYMCDDNTSGLGR